MNAADAKIYNNTFLDAPASFERNQRSATGDHFGWHPATGPGVEEREGHVFVNNLMVASEGSRRPLARFEQPAAMCQQLAKPMASEINGNVYVRAELPGAAPAPLATWSPSPAAPNCMATAMSVDEYRKLAAGYEAGGRQLDLTPHSIFKGPEVGRYEPIQMLQGSAAAPAGVLKLLGWSEQEGRTAGAYPARR